MDTLFTSQVSGVMNATHYRPAVSVILPLECKVNLKSGTIGVLKKASNCVRKELYKRYPDELADLMINKLNDIFRQVYPPSGKKSVAVYLSPVFKKIIYLDFKVEEKIIIDESFEIRDLVYSNTEVSKFLVLLLSSKKSRIYLWDPGSLVPILPGIPASVDDFATNMPGMVANFSDKGKQKEIMMERLLFHIDSCLDKIFKDYTLPVFVIGTKRISGHFKKITKHGEAITGYINGNLDEMQPDKLNSLLDPFIRKWRKDKDSKLLRQLEDAADKKLLVAGISKVWNMAMNNKGKLLVIEKNYRHSASHGSDKDVIYPGDILSNTFSLIKDAVDDVIEKVLQNGGQVEFVDHGCLKDYQQIALITYY